MKTDNKIQKYKKDINSCINTYCLMLRDRNAKLFYMLSPNFRALTQVDGNKDKCESAFIFGRKIVASLIYSLSEVAPGLLEAIVIFRLRPVDCKKSYADITEDEWMYRVYKFRFIDIDGHWYIDDVNLYNEFWGNEFKRDMC